MVDTEKLKRRITYCCGSMKNCAEILNVNASSFNLMVNGKRNISLELATKLISILEIPYDEIHAYFFIS